MKNGIIYKGPSQIDGKRLLLLVHTQIATLKRARFYKPYILRENVNPLEASKTGQDYSICGDCPDARQGHDGSKKKNC